MHNAAVEALGLNWRYLAFDVRPERLGEALAGARTMHFIGLNLTVPHKVLAVGLMDVLDDSAKCWGAVNTVRFEARDENGDWKPLREFEDVPAEVRSHGFNTDADAIVRALREDLKMTLPGKRVLLLGAGGAGRTAALKLASEGVAELFLVNRTETKAQDLAQELRRLFPRVKSALGYPSGKVDLVLNATSLGLKPEDPLPLAAEKFSLRNAAAVYDMIYRPAETPLLKRAKVAGCRTANGLGMLLYQGAQALELWTGRASPTPLMRQVLEQHVCGES